MIVQSIQSIWGTIYNQYINTVYRTLEDPISQKTYIEIVEYTYDKQGKIEEPSKGRSVDKQA